MKKSTIIEILLWLVAIGLCVSILVRPVGEVVFGADPYTYSYHFEWVIVVLASAFVLTLLVRFIAWLSGRKKSAKDIALRLGSIEATLTQQSRDLKGVGVAISENMRTLIEKTLTEHGNKLKQVGENINENVRNFMGDFIEEKIRKLNTTASDLLAQLQILSVSTFNEQLQTLSKSMDATNKLLSELPKNAGGVVSPESVERLGEQMERLETLVEKLDTGSASAKIRENLTTDSSNGVGVSPEEFKFIADELKAEQKASKDRFEKLSVSIQKLSMITEQMLRKEIRKEMTSVPSPIESRRTEELENKIQVLEKEKEALFVANAELSYRSKQTEELKNQIQVLENEKEALSAVNADLESISKNIKDFEKKIQSLENEKELLSVKNAELESQTHDLISTNMHLQDELRDRN